MEQMTLEQIEARLEDESGRACMPKLGPFHRLCDLLAAVAEVVDVIRQARADGAEIAYMPATFADAFPPSPAPPTSDDSHWTLPPKPEPATAPPASSEPIATADQAAEVAYDAAVAISTAVDRPRCGDAVEVSPFLLDRLDRDLRALGRWAEGRAKAEAERDDAFARLDAEQKMNAALTIKIADMGSTLRKVRDAVVNA